MLAMPLHGRCHVTACMFLHNEERVGGTVLAMPLRGLCHVTACVLLHIEERVVFTNTNIAGTRTLPGTTLRASWAQAHGGFNVGTLPLRVSLGRSRSPAQSPSIRYTFSPWVGHPCWDFTVLAMPLHGLCRVTACVLLHTCKSFLLGLVWVFSLNPVAFVSVNTYMCICTPGLVGKVTKSDAGPGEGGGILHVVALLRVNLTVSHVTRFVCLVCWYQHPGLMMATPWGCYGCLNAFYLGGTSQFPMTGLVLGPGLLCQLDTFKVDHCSVRKPWCCTTA